jgi:hypothetical protein
MDIVEIHNRWANQSLLFPNLHLWGLEDVGERDVEIFKQGSG